MEKTFVRPHSRLEHEDRHIPQDGVGGSQVPLLLLVRDDPHVSRPFLQEFHLPNRIRPDVALSDRAEISHWLSQSVHLAV